MTFENQNKRAKVRLELSEGVLVEVPLVLVVRAIQEQYMRAKEGIAMRNPWVHWAFPDIYVEDNEEQVHLLIASMKGKGAIKSGPLRVELNHGSVKVSDNLGPDNGNE